MQKIISKYNLDQSTWTHKGFHGVLHTLFPVGQSGFPMEKFFGDCCNTTLFFIKDNYGHWYWNDLDLTRIRELFLQRIKSDPNYLKKLQKDWQEELHQFDLIIDKIDRTNLSKLSNKALIDLYDKFYNLYLTEYTRFMAIGDALSMHADRYLMPEFEKVLGKDFNKVFPELIKTKHLSFLEEEQIDHQKIASKFKIGKNIDKDLEKHSRKYFYIENNYAKAIYLKPEDFLNKIKNESNQSELQKDKLVNNSQELIKKYHLSKWHKTLLYIMDEFFGIQDTRKKYVLISNYYQFKFLEELSKRSGIDLDLLKYSVFPEFVDILYSKFDKSIFEERKNICLCIQTPKNYEIFTGEDAVNLLDKFLNINKEQKELKGIVASKGVASGNVKIILKTHDMINMNKGDILVTSMTRPEMLSAMRLAGAIVTDEGGITCHAAIISRELGIPCIIGTKIATQILKDGDTVEVDANNGIIRKLGQC